MEPQAFACNGNRLSEETGEGYLAGRVLVVVENEKVIHMAKEDR